MRLRILKERALPRVEDFWFDPSNEHLCAAAAELLLNMLYCEGYFKDVIKVCCLALHLLAGWVHLIFVPRYLNLFCI